MKNLLLLIVALFCVACNKPSSEDLGGSTSSGSTNDNPIPYKEIWYTSTDGKIVNPSWPLSYDGSLVYNEYKNGKGIMAFSEDVTHIGESMFFNRVTLKSISLPNSVTKIGKDAFAGCSNLKDVSLPVTIESIGANAFASCASLKTFTVPSNVSVLEEGVFNTCKKLTSITLSANLTKISQGAFTSCHSLKSLTLPNALQEVETLVFASCSALEKFEGKFASKDGRCLIIGDKVVAFAPAGLTEYTIPEGITTIGESAFSYNTELEHVTIPEGVTTIEKSAFFYCFEIKSITIPSSVTRMEQYCCQSASSSDVIIYCKPTTPPVAYVEKADSSWDGFSANSRSPKTIYVPTESVEAYKSAEHWSNYADKIQGYNF